MGTPGMLNPGEISGRDLGAARFKGCLGSLQEKAEATGCPRSLELCRVGVGLAWPVGTSPGHELVQLLLVLLVLGGDGVLGLLLHGLDEVLHVLEGIDLQ